MGDIRLPELAVFKRYSLALRQERAAAEEILGMLERSVAQVEGAIADEDMGSQKPSAKKPVAKKRKPGVSQPRSVVRVSPRGKPIKS